MPIDISFKTDSNAVATTYNDQNYINVEGDTLQGNLDLNNHKITNVGSPTEPSDCVSKQYVDNLGVRHNPENDMETQGKFIVKNPQSNRANSNIINFLIHKDEIHCSSKRVTNLLPPVNNNDACTKGYVDSQIVQTKAIFSNYVKGSMLTIKFDLSRMAPSTVHRLSNPSEQTFFVLSARYQTSDNLWDARDNAKVADTVKDNFLPIERKGLFPTRELTGVGEVLLIRGGDPIDIADLQPTSGRTTAIGVASIN